MLKNSNKVLGIKIRGTEYIKLKLKAYPIPSSLDRAINDVKKLNVKNNYDWIFISREDELIKERLINIEYTKNFVMNIFILGKCTDIDMSRGSEGIG